MKYRRLKTSAVMGMLLSMVLGTNVYAAPIGGQVVSGNSTINQGGNTTTITQKSQNTRINWQKFNIARNETVNFVQPNKSAVALNKVVGNDASAIYGNLNANGQVFLVNPNGILFGKTASVNVGGLVASTLDIKANENGKYTFEGSGGTITNEGKLKVNGNLILAASIVNNQGTITNNSGTTQLVAADKITLDTGEAYTITVDKGALNAQINNGGAIYGNDGKVYLTAKGRDSLSNAVINHTGVIEANAVKSGEGGKIILLSDMSTGTTNVSGTLHAKGTTGDGGFIETSGAKVKIADSAQISTASEQGKYGTWLIDPKNFTIGSGLEDTETGISGTALGTKLASNNIEIKTVNDNGTEDGDIFVNDAITWDAATELKLNAFRNIEINNPITATTGSVALYYGQGAEDGKINGTAATYTINMKDGYKAGNGAINLSAGNNFSTKLGSDGAVKTYTVITALGSAGDESKDTTNSLQGLANSGKVSGNYVLGADIDASDTAAWNSSAGFVPIGNAPDYFTGNFDGLGHTISGLTINRPTTENVGLFGYATNADISNVGMVGGSITGQGSVGGLVGYQNSGSIENAYATGEVTGSYYVGGLVGWQGKDTSIMNAYTTGKVSGTSLLGGLVGYQASGGTVTNAYATGAVTGTSGNVGGLVGYQAIGTVTNAYATGAVTGTGSVGGFVGFQDSGTVTNAYATGVVTGTSDDVGGLVGYQASGTVTNAYATGKVSGVANVGGLVGVQKGRIENVYATGVVTGTSDNVGGLVGYQASGGTITNAYWDVVTTNQSNAIGEKHGTGTPTAVYYSSSTPSAFAQASYGNFDFTSTWYMVEGQSRPMLRAFAATTKASDGKYHITNLNELQGMAADLAGDYVMDNDIDASATAASVTNNNQADVWGGRGFAAAGTYDAKDSSKSFTGTFDGMGHTINDLTINRSATDYVGLFGCTTGNISNVGMVGGSITGQGYVGGLVGYQNSGSIENAYATGAVTGTGNYVGGLVGYQKGSIENAYATGAVSGAGNVGGLVGWQASGTVTNAYATGAVSGTENVGGLVGYQASSSITNAYATGAVTGTTVVGGLVGWNNGNIKNAYATGNVMGTFDVGGLVGVQKSGGSVESAYATGKVTGSYYVGGLMGVQNSGGTITNAYWDIESTGKKSAFSSQSGTASTAAISFSGKDAASAFAQTSYKISDTEQFDFENTWYMIEGQTRPMLRAFKATKGTDNIYHITNLQQLQDMAYDLSGNYVLDNNIDASATAGTDISSVWGSSGFVPVGTYDANDLSKKFTGTFDGLGYTINDLTINRSTTDYVGLFGYITNDISNVGIVGGSVTGNYNVGGLVGYQYSGSIENAYTTGAVTGSYYVGGLVGRQQGSITNAYATGVVKGAGQSNQLIGGLVGWQAKGSITNAYATGNVTGTTDVGGLVGQQADGSIKNAYATGDVIGTYGFAGGLVGRKQGSVTNAYATGDVTGTTAVGGLVGWNYDNITNAYATGKVSGNKDVGGLVGYKFDGTIITSSYWDNTVNSDPKYDNDLGTGTSTGDLKKATTFAGWDLDTTGGQDKVWRIYEDKTSPLLKVFLKPMTVTADVSNNNVTYNGKEQSAVVSNIKYNGNTTKDDKVEGTISTGGKGTNAGTYAITTSGLYSTQDGYDIVNGIADDLTINKATITAVTGITANDKTYDGTTTAGLVTTGTGIGFTGIIDGDKLTVDKATGTFANKNAGTGKVVSITGITLGGEDAENYILTTTTAADTADISAKEITAVTGITANDKTYDGTTTAGLVTTGAGIGFTGMITDDDLSVKTATGTFANKNVGIDKAVSITGITLGGNDAGNYILTTTTAADTADIVAREITAVTGITANDKTYDGTTTAGLVTTGAGIGFTGMITKDDLSVKTATGTFANKNVGIDKAVSITGITLGGNDAGNYILTTATAADTANISAKEITAVTGITANDKTYDGNTTAGLVTTGTGIGFTGMITKDDLSVKTATGTFANKNVGIDKAVSITGITLGGDDAGNYILTNATAADTANISAREITAVTGITANDKTYDGNTKADLVTTGTGIGFAGIVDGDNLTVLTADGAFADKNAGKGKTVNISGITIGAGEGTDINNYTLKASAATTTTTATIAKKDLTLTAVTANKEYDGTTKSTEKVIVDGLIDTDNISGLTQAYDSKNVMGTNSSTLRVLNSYTILDTDNQNMSGNYAITANTASGTITPKVITGITGLATNDKTYDGTTAVQMNTTNAKLGGVVSGDDLVLASATGTYATKNAGDNIGISVGNIVLGGTDAGNYAVTSATDLPELIGSISKGSLYITADDIERNSGIPFSFNGTEFKASGLASGETVSYVALNSDGADISATQGTYPINISGAKGSFAAANYDITYINGIMTVRPMESFKFAAAYPMQTISRHSKDDTLYGNRATAYSLDYLRKREVKEALPTITVIGTGINTGNV